MDTVKKERTRPGDEESVLPDAVETPAEEEQVVLQMPAKTARTAEIATLSTLAGIMVLATAITVYCFISSRKRQQSLHDLAESLKKDEDNTNTAAAKDTNTTSNNINNNRDNMQQKRRFICCPCCRPDLVMEEIWVRQQAEKNARKRSLRDSLNLLKEGVKHQESFQRSMKKPRTSTSNRTSHNSKSNQLKRHRHHRPGPFHRAKYRNQELKPRNYNSHRVNTPPFDFSRGDPCAIGNASCRAIPGRNRASRGVSDRGKVSGQPGLGSSEFNFEYSGNLKPYGWDRFWNTGDFTNNEGTWTAGQEYCPPLLGTPSNEESETNSSDDFDNIRSCELPNKRPGYYRNAQSTTYPPPHYSHAQTQSAVYTPEAYSQPVQSHPPDNVQQYPPMGYSTNNSSARYVSPGCPPPFAQYNPNAQSGYHNNAQYAHGSHHQHQSYFQGAPDGSRNKGPPDWPRWFVPQDPANHPNYPQSHYQDINYDPSVIDSYGRLNISQNYNGEDSGVCSYPSNSGSNHNPPSFNINPVFDFNPPNTVSHPSDARINPVFSSDHNPPNTDFNVTGFDKYPVCASKFDPKNSGSRLSISAVDPVTGCRSNRSDLDMNPCHRPSSDLPRVSFKPSKCHAKVITEQAISCNPSDTNHMSGQTAFGSTQTQAGPNSGQLGSESNRKRVQDIEAMSSNTRGLLSADNVTPSKPAPLCSAGNMPLPAPSKAAPIKSGTFPSMARRFVNACQSLTSNIPRKQNLQYKIVPNESPSTDTEKGGGSCTSESENHAFNGDTSESDSTTDTKKRGFARRIPWLRAFTGRPSTNRKSRTQQRLPSFDTKPLLGGFCSEHEDFQDTPRNDSAIRNMGQKPCNEMPIPDVDIKHSKDVPRKAITFETQRGDPRSNAGADLSRLDPGKNLSARPSGLGRIGRRNKGYKTLDPFSPSVSFTQNGSGDKRADTQFLCEENTPLTHKTRNVDGAFLSYEELKLASGVPWKKKNTETEDMFSISGEQTRGRFAIRIENTAGKTGPYQTTRQNSLCPCNEKTPFLSLDSSLGNVGDPASTSTPAKNPTRQEYQKLPQVISSDSDLSSKMSAMKIQNVDRSDDKTWPRTCKPVGLLDHGDKNLPSSSTPMFCTNNTCKSAAKASDRSSDGSRVVQYLMDYEEESDDDSDTRNLIDFYDDTESEEDEEEVPVTENLIDFDTPVRFAQPSTHLSGGRSGANRSIEVSGGCGEAQEIETDDGPDSFGPFLGAQPRTGCLRNCWKEKTCVRLPTTTSTGTSKNSGVFSQKREKRHRNPIRMTLDILGSFTQRKRDDMSKLCSPEKAERKTTTTKLGQTLPLSILDGSDMKFTDATDEKRNDGFPENSCLSKKNDEPESLDVQETTPPASTSVKARGNVLCTPRDAISDERTTEQQNGSSISYAPDNLFSVPDKDEFKDPGAGMKSSARNVFSEQSSNRSKYISDTGKDFDVCLLNVAHFDDSSDDDADDDNDDDVDVEDSVGQGMLNMPEQNKINDNDSENNFFTQCMFNSTLEKDKPEDRDVDNSVTQPKLDVQTTDNFPTENSFTERRLGSLKEETPEDAYIDVTDLPKSGTISQKFASRKKKPVRRALFGKRYGLLSEDEAEGMLSDYSREEQEDNLMPERKRVACIDLSPSVI